jgi:hypothetical protein
LDNINLARENTTSNNPSPKAKENTHQFYIRYTLTNILPTTQLRQTFYSTIVKNRDQDHTYQKNVTQKIQINMKSIDIISIMEEIKM